MADRSGGEVTSTLIDVVRDDPRNSSFRPETSVTLSDRTDSRLVRADGSRGWIERLGPRTRHYAQSSMNPHVQAFWDGTPVSPKVRSSICDHIRSSLPSDLVRELNRCDQHESGSKKTTKARQRLPVQESIAVTRQPVFACVAYQRRLRSCGSAPVGRRWFSAAAACCYARADALFLKNHPDVAQMTRWDWRLDRELGNQGRCRALMHSIAS